MLNLPCIFKTHTLKLLLQPLYPTFHSQIILLPRIKLFIPLYWRLLINIYHDWVNHTEFRLQSCRYSSTSLLLTCLRNITRGVDNVRETFSAYWSQDYDNDKKELLVLLHRIIFLGCMQFTKLCCQLEFKTTIIYWLTTLL